MACPTSTPVLVSGGHDARWWGIGRRRNNDGGRDAEGNGRQRSARANLAERAATSLERSKKLSVTIVAEGRRWVGKGPGAEELEAGGAILYHSSTSVPHMHPCHRNACATGLETVLGD